MMMADYNGRFLVANRVFRNKLGYSQSELGRINLIKALRRADGRIYRQEGAILLQGINTTTLASRLRAFKIRTARPH
jgi:PAS domain-containing protein